MRAIVDNEFETLDMLMLIMHSPLYNNPCAKECLLCNMDKTRYTEMIAEMQTWNALTEEDIE